MLLASAANTVQHATYEGHCASPIWPLVIRGFLLWRCIASMDKRSRLRNDLEMMVILLQQTSGTIEELRVRLVSVRIYGIIRRQVFTAWHKVVEDKYASQIASATYDRSRGSRTPSRTPSVVGDVPSSRPGTPSDTSYQPLPRGPPSRPRTPSIAGLMGDPGRVSSRPNSGRSSSKGVPVPLALTNDSLGGSASTASPPARRASGSGLPSGIPSPPSAAGSREALVRQLQQAREALTLPRR